MTKKHNCALNATDPDDATQATGHQCPLAGTLKQLGDSRDHYLYFDALLDLDILQRVPRGYYIFTEMANPCPFAQAQQETQPVEDKP